MSAEIVPFPHSVTPITPIAHYIHLGDSGYQKLADLHSSGRLPARRVIVDASKMVRQRDLIDGLRKEGAEIVIDTKAAELSVVGKFSGRAKDAPWAKLNDGLPLSPDIFSAGHRTDIFGAIARFAVEHRAHAVLAPSHCLADPKFSGWFAVDQEACRLLRKALDREGGQRIEIDFPVIVPHSMLNQDEFRRGLLEALPGLPFANLWIRAGNFGSDATAAGTAKFIGTLSGLHNLGRPIIADHLGGLVGAAAIACGAVSGIGHGIGERERFDANDWYKVPERRDDASFGRAVRIQIPGLDRSLTVSELQLLGSAKGGKALVACGDRHCCPHGLRDMINEPRRHAAFQCFAAMDELAKTPDLRRETHFMKSAMEPSLSLASQVKELRPSAEDARKLDINVDNLMKRLNEHAARQRRMKLTLEHLFEQRGDRRPRAPPASLRGAAGEPRSHSV